MQITPETLNWKTEDYRHLTAYFDYRPDMKGYIKLQLATIDNHDPLIIVYVYDSIRRESRIGVTIQDKEAVHRKISQLIPQICEEHAHHSYKLYDLMTSNN